MKTLLLDIRFHLQEVKKYGSMLANSIVLHCYENEETLDVKALRGQCEKAFSYVNMVLQGTFKVSPQSILPEAVSMMCEFEACMISVNREDTSDAKHPSVC